MNKKVKKFEILTFRLVIILIIPILSYGRDFTSRESNRIKYGILGVSAQGMYSLPVREVYNVINSGFGPEIKITYRNFLLDELHLQLTGSYNTYTGKVDNSERFDLIAIKLLGRYDILHQDIMGVAGVVYVDVGGGIGVERLTMPLETFTNTDPIYVVGFGYEIGLMENITAQIGMNYSYLYQKYMGDADRNGAFFNINFGINYEFINNRKRR